jgi:hypothetical protein
MHSYKFIPVNVLIEHANTQLQFINTDHILRLWQTDTSVYIEMTDYTILHVPDENMYSLLERFIKS